MSYTQYKTVNFGAGKTGLATVGYTVNGSRSTAGVTELHAGSGSYGALVSFPDAYAGSILWDTGDASPSYAADEVNPGPENLDAKVSTRSTYAGGAVASVTGAVGSVTGNVGGSVGSVTGNVGGITGVSFPTNFSALAITAGGLISINLAQTGLTPRALDAVADASLTVGDGLVCAIAGAAGKETVSGTSYVVKTPSTGTVIRTFTLDSATAPTSRT